MGNTSVDVDYSSCSFSDLLVKKSDSDNSKSFKKYTRWSDIEEKKVKEFYNQGISVADIAQSLGRTKGSVVGKIKHLDLKRFRHLSIDDEQFLKRNYWLLGLNGCAKKLGRKRSAVAYFVKALNLKIPTHDQYDPPIYRKLLPYDMAKRISILQRKSPTSRDKIEDAVVILYDQSGPAKALAAVHLDELCLALDRHFNRRDGVTAGALINGWKR